MTLPHIDFVGMTPSPALRAEVQRQVMRLTHQVPRLSSCHVVVRRSEGHRQHGPLFAVQVRATLPGGSFEVGRSPATREHADAYAAVREAFAILRRQVEEFQTVRQAHRQDGPRNAATA